MPALPARPNTSSENRLWSVRGTAHDLSRAGMVMGIVNVTPDSFSDGGQFSTYEAANKRALELESEGAQIVDFGGESTRPGAAEVSADEERRRILPAIERFAAQRSPHTLISADTSKPEVASAALAAGADILNDVTGFTNPAMRAAAATSDCGLVIMHMLGDPRSMQHAPRYDDVVAEVRAFFEKQIATCHADGIDPERIALDPGIGFGKSLEHNLALLRGLPELRVDGRPLLVGVSRKSFIGKLLGSDAIEDRDTPTVALTAYCRERGAEIHRVHDARPNVEAMRMTEAILFG
jgi:dihydropteroate synthase